MSRDTLASLRLRCNKLGEALEDARATIDEMRRENASATTPEHGDSALNLVAESIRYGNLRELVAQLRTALPAIDLERLRKALDEP